MKIGLADRNIVTFSFILVVCQLFLYISAIRTCSLANLKNYMSITVYVYKQSKVGKKIAVYV